MFRKQKIHARPWAIWACAACLALAAPLAPAGALDGCTPTMLTAPVPQKGICYGTASWIENGNKRKQNFDFYAAASSTPTPLVIWAHPNEMTKALPEDGAMYQALIPPALAAGFSVASIEFRHPVTNEGEAVSNGGLVPHLDVARALQYIRANAKALNIDPKNIFFAGQSRGTLTLWTALQDDMADASGDRVAQQSTRVNAVFGVNAQTTYDGLEFDSLFIVPRDRPTADAAFIAQHPDDYTQFGSAIRSVNAGYQADPPVKLRYDSKPIKRLLTYEEMLQLDYIHYADFGLALCKAYQDKFGDLTRCHYEADERFKDNPLEAYAGYVEFFKKHLKTP